MAQRWHQKATVQVAAITGLALIAAALIPIAFRVPSLTRENAQLARELQSRETDILRLETLLAPFRTIALDRYTGTEAEALARLARRIEEIEGDLYSLREYSEVARLDPFGKPFREGAGITFESPLSKALEGAYSIVDGRVFPVSGPEQEAKHLNVIEHFPRFPFSYYSMAMCLHSRQDPRWRDYADKAISIFGRTTQIAGHNKAHGQAYEQLRTLIQEEQDLRSRTTPSTRTQ